MRRIKLSGREMGLIRSIGFGMGASGKELLEATHFDPVDLVDMINGMMNAGFIVTVPYLLEISENLLEETQFEINGGYMHELKHSLTRRI